MAATTDRFALPLLQSGQAQKEVTHNSAIAAIDGLLHLAVESGGVAAPPSAPAIGTAYIVGSVPSGAWAGHAGAIAAFDSAGWTLTAPREGCLALVKDLGVVAVYAGGVWRYDGWPAAALIVRGRRLLAGEPARLPPATGGTVVDVEARAAISAIAAALVTMGLAIAT